MTSLPTFTIDNRPIDIAIEDAGFSATTITFRATTTAGKEAFNSVFGRGCLDATMPKSEGGRFIAFMKARNLRIG